MTITIDGTAEEMATLLRGVPKEIADFILKMQGQQRMSAEEFIQQYCESYTHWSNEYLLNHRTKHDNDEEYPSSNDEK